MWNHENRQILFVPGSDFTDPSYHLPHFYELFALWADEEDRLFFKEAAKVSRKYLAKACHEKTGMSAEYAEFDGQPMSRPLPWTTDRHDWFFSDAYRTVANIGLDYEWFGIDEGQYEAPEKLLRFLDARWDEDPFEIYEVDGTSLHEPALRTGRFRSGRRHRPCPEGRRRRQPRFQRRSAGASRRRADR